MVKQLSSNARALIKFNKGVWEADVLLSFWKTPVISIAKPDGELKFDTIDRYIQPVSFARYLNKWSTIDSYSI